MEQLIIKEEGIIKEIPAKFIPIKDKINMDFFKDKDTLYLSENELHTLEEMLLDWVYQYFLENVFDVSCIKILGKSPIKKLIRVIRKNDIQWLMINKKGKHVWIGTPGYPVNAPNYHGWISYDSLLHETKHMDEVMEIIDKKTTTIMKIILIDGIQVYVPDDLIRQYEKSNIARLDRLKFELLTRKVSTWDELGIITGFYTDKLSKICSFRGNTDHRNKNTFVKKIHQEAALAAAQLSQLMDRYESHRRVSWEDSTQQKWVICSFEENIHIKGTFETHFIAFTNKKDCEEFLKLHLDLIEVFVKVFG